MTNQTPDGGVPTEHGQPPVPPADPHAATPMYPGGPVPPKKGLPGWALALIIGGGVLLIGVIVVAVLVFSLIANSVKNQADPEPESTPVATEEASPDPGLKNESIPLSGSADFGGPPIWGAPYLSGWDIKILDQEGINSFENLTLGCTFTTSQNIQDVDRSSSSDEASSRSLMDVLKNEIFKRSPDSVEAAEDIVDLSIGASGSSSTIEFLSSRLDFTASSGEFTSVIFARSMPHSGSYMYTHLECTRAAIDGADSPLQTLTDQLAVVPSP